MFGYDDLYRLTSASGVYGAITYTNDKVGNRLSRTHNSDQDAYHYYPGTNLLNIVAGKHPEQILYDSDGNTTQRIPGATNPVPGVTDPADYFYNSGGQRVKKDNSVDKVFHYDLAGRLIAETDATGALIKTYIWLHGEPLAQIAADGAVYYYHNDHLGTPQKMTDAGGAQVWAADYLPFGQADVTIATVENYLRFAGQYYDDETGLIYNYHRYYDPKTGRYLTPDPIGQAGGINRYPYVLNNPVNNIDPEGLVGWGPALRWVGKQIVKQIGKLFGKKVGDPEIGHPMTQQEMDVDSDGDGISDYKDLDSDWDTDGIPNCFDPDDDNDGIPDNCDYENNNVPVQEENQSNCE